MLAICYGYRTGMSVMHVATMVPKIGESVKRIRPYLWTVLWALLSMWAAYNLGAVRARYSALPTNEQSALSVRHGIVSRSVDAGQGSGRPARSDTRVVVSSASSSMKYHHPWCSGASRIKEENRVWYPSAEAAQADGYSRAGNCAP